MKKHILLFSSLLVLASCRDGDKKDEIPTYPITKPIAPQTTSLELKAVSDLSNLQVGETFRFTYNISDTDSNMQGVKYIIRPVTENKVHHQRLNKDFNLLNEEGQSVEKLETTNLKGEAGIKILQPGTFQHEYILEKYQDGKLVSTTSQKFVFNAVKITAFTRSEEVRKPGFWNHSIHRRSFIFTIDDGVEQYDNYLTEADGKKTQSYVVEYNGGSLSGRSITADSEREFSTPVEKEREAPAIPSFVISRLLIKQKIGDEPVNNIEYLNIPVVVK